MVKDRSLGLVLKAVDRMSSTIDKVQSKFPKLSRKISQASRVVSLFNDQTKRMRKNLTRIGGRLKDFGSGLTRFVTLPLAAGAAAGVKFFIDFEKGLLGVQKTTGLSAKAVSILGKRFDLLSTKIPVSIEELLELAQAAGQLGVNGADNIEKFTATMAKLSRASDVAGEDGAKSIARILTVTGTGIEKVDRFAAALVDLGNNAAASESEILAVANRVAGSIGRFDVGSDKILGISTALRAMGKEAEVSGSVVGRAFDSIDQAIRKGGNEALLLSKLTGITVANLKKQFSKDAASVFEKFVKGLSKVEKGGGNLIKVMEFLGLSGVRINDVLGTLAKRPEVLAENMNRATKAFDENTALQKEFDIQVTSLGSELILLKNTFVSLATVIGDMLAPIVRGFSVLIRGIFNFLKNNPTIATLTAVFAGLVAVMGPVLIAFGAFLVILPNIMAGATALGIALLPLTLKFTLIAAGVSLLITLGVVLIKKWDAIKKFFTVDIFAIFRQGIADTVESFAPLLDAANSLLDTFVKISTGNFSISDKLTSLKDKILSPFSFGDDGNDSKKSNENILGPAIGAQNKNEVQFQQRFSPIEQKVGGAININFKNAPPGTRISSESNGIVDLNLGLSGGIL